jgi:outer membrane biosynthesis protein TonB
MKQDKEKPETSSPAEEQKPQVSESAKTKEKAPTTEKQKAQASEEQKARASEEQKAEPEAPKPAPQASLKEVIAKQAIEEEESGSASFTLRKILGGDILTAQIIRKQIWLFMLIVFFIIIYISNRYSIQKDLIELDQLQKELQDTKYKALSTSSQITEKSRESNVLDMLKHSKDSTLHIATQPPYIINVPEE